NGRENQSGKGTAHVPSSTVKENKKSDAIPEPERKGADPPIPAEPGRTFFPEPRVESKTRRPPGGRGGQRPARRDGSRTTRTEPERKGRDPKTRRKTVALYLEPCLARIGQRPCPKRHLLKLSLRKYRIKRKTTFFVNNPYRRRAAGLRRRCRRPA